MSKKRPLPRILSISEYLNSEIKINVDKRLVDFHFPTHSHEFYEIEFVIDGNAQYIVNNKTCELKKGSLYFVTPADIHRVNVIPDSFASVINIQFDEKSVEPSLMLNFLRLNQEKPILLFGEDYEYAAKISCLLKRNSIAKLAVNEDNNFIHISVVIISGTFNTFVAA